MKNFVYLFVIFFFLFTSCKSSFYLKDVSETNEKIDSNIVFLDSNIYKIVQPYSVSLNAKMNETIGKAEEEFTLKQPESTLGNLLADAVLEMTPKYFLEKVDFAIVNYGGIRVPSLAKGNITLGNAYELMPFDNYVVIVKVKGSELQAIFDLMATKKGWPIAGAQYKISEGKATNILIGNQEIKTDYIYSIALSDYLANGGDDMSMLKTVKQENNNIILRDLFIAFFKEKKQAQTPLVPVLENRVRYE